MTCIGIRRALAATMLAALPGVAFAQFPPPPGPPAASSSPTVQDRWPDPPKAPAARAPVAAPKPSQAKAPPSGEKASPSGEEALQTPAHKPAPRPPAQVVACNGVFAKDSTHLKLAIKYDSRNVVFGQVDGPDGTKIPASIVFPNDPRKRLEVLWNNEASHSETQVIAINGKSQWVAPKGLKLGLAVAALEKINGKPFKLSSFGADGSASVLGWEGGALSTLPGGCKVGLRLFEDAKTPQGTRDAVTGDKELLSSDASVRAVKPSVAEILIGY